MNQEGCTEILAGRVGCTLSCRLATQLYREATVLSERSKMAGGSKMIKSVSVKSGSQSRTGWSILVMKVQSRYQVHVMWRKFCGDITFYSNVDKRVNVRPAFGQVVECEYLRCLNDGGQVQESLVFKNQDNERIRCNFNIFNIFMKDTHEFNQFLAKLRTEGKLELMGDYITLIARSEGFGGYNLEKFSVEGFKLDGTGVTKETLVQKGGAVEELQELLKLAKNNAFEFNRTAQPQDDVRPNTEGRKRKMTDFFVNENQKSSGKLSKMEVLAKDFEEECADERGVEKVLSAGIVGKLGIKLSNLSPSPKLALPVNQRKVNNIAQSMLSRFDPAACVLTVCKASDHSIETEEQQYHVLHGVHRLLALQKIEREEGLAERLRLG